MSEIPLPDGCFTYEPAVLKEILKGRCLLPEIEQEYQLCRSFWTDAQENWRDTAWHQRIKKHFRRALIESSTPITQVICMGLGSFARHFAFRAHGGDFRDCGDLTYHQLCVLEFLLDLLARHQKTFDAGKVYFQDPSFLDVDEEFLRSKGFSIMRVPQAENMMTSSTFLYAPILPSNLLFDAFTVDYPAVYVGDLRERELEEDYLNHPKGAARARACKWDLDHVRHFVRNWSTFELSTFYHAGDNKLIQACQELKWRPVGPGTGVTKTARHVTTEQMIRRRDWGEEFESDTEEVEPDIKEEERREDGKKSLE